MDGTVDILPGIPYYSEDVFLFIGLDGKNERPWNSRHGFNV